MSETDKGFPVFEKGLSGREKGLTATDKGLPIGQKRQKPSKKAVSPSGRGLNGSHQVFRPAGKTVPLVRIGFILTKRNARVTKYAKLSILAPGSVSR